jgi:hypothetical protein
MDIRMAGSANRSKYLGIASVRPSALDFVMYLGSSVLLAYLADRVGFQVFFPHYLILLQPFPLFLAYGVEAGFTLKRGLFHVSINIGVCSPT